MQLPVRVEQRGLVKGQHQARGFPLFHLWLTDVRAESRANEELQAATWRRVANRNQINLPVGDTGAGRDAKSAAEPRTIGDDDGAEGLHGASGFIVYLNLSADAAI